MLSRRRVGLLAVHEQLHLGGGFAQQLPYCHVVGDGLAILSLPKHRQLLDLELPRLFQCLQEGGYTT